MLNYLIKRRNRKGQSTLEYAILIIIILGALLSIQMYIKRGIQGRYKKAADDIGDQFSPGNTNVRKVMTTSSETQESFKSGVSRKDSVKDEITKEEENSFVINQNQEYWGG